MLDGRAEIRVRRRTFGVEQLVTVALVNAARHEQALGTASRRRVFPWAWLGLRCGFAAWLPLV
ncbi:hypothetical protein [Streptomyces sp. NPDC002133]|uniref:hypothetical protein n=1 Tax=Streptomyces sp. NPDC002133 TaxID=3154409 RepID=UPI0033279200